MENMKLDVRELFAIIGEHDAEIYALNKLIAEQRAQIEELLAASALLKEVVK